ncbi:MAG: molecular chaperone HtpG, partial [Flavobacteriaceae bacterium]
LFKKDRADFEQKWNDIKVIIEYGMLSEDKFFDKAKKFALYPTVADSYFTFDELVENTKDTQTDKDGNHVILYASNKDAQHSYIQDATAKGYEVLLLDSPIVSHLMQKLETSGDAKIQFKRVDADHIDNLIKKDDTVISKLSDEEKEKLKPVIEGAVNNTNYTVQLESMDSSSSPFIITVPEFMRRMKEMQASGGGGMMGMGNLPEMYNLVVNTNHPLVSEILNAKEEDQKRLTTQAFDLAKLSQNLLHGEELTNFIKRSYDLIK